MLADEVIAGESVSTKRSPLHLRLVRSRFFWHNVASFVSTIATAGLNYLLHPILVRLLGFSSYATIASLLALQTILTIPTQIIATVVTRHASVLSGLGDTAQLNTLIRRLTAILLPTGFIVMLIYFAASKYVVAYLHLGSSQGVLIMGFIFIFMFAGPVTGGVVQGQQRFFWLSAIGTSTVLVRFGLAVALVLLGLGVDGVILGIVLSAAFGYFIFFWPLYDLLKGPRASHAPLLPLLSVSITAALALTSTSLLVNVDTLLAKHFLSAQDAGLYAVLSVLGRVVLFVSASVAGVMLPRVAMLHARGEHTAWIVVQSLFGVLIISSVVEALFLLTPDLVLRVLYGKAMTGHALSVVSGQLAWYGLAMLMLALGQALITYFLSVNDRVFVFIALASCSVQAFLIYVRHQSIVELVQAAVVADGLLLGLLISLFAMRAWPTRPIESVAA